MKYLAKYVNRKVLDQSYKLYIRPYLDYGDIIYHGQLTDMMKCVESVQYQAAIIVSGCIKGTSRVELYKELGWESLHDRRVYHRLLLYYKIRNHETPTYLNDYIKALPEIRTQRFEKSFFPFCQSAWQSLSDDLKNAHSIGILKTNISTIFAPLNVTHLIYETKEGYDY